MEMTVLDMTTPGCGVALGWESASPGSGEIRVVQKKILPGTFPPRRCLSDIGGTDGGDPPSGIGRRLQVYFCALSRAGSNNLAMTAVAGPTVTRGAESGPIVVVPKIE